MLNDFLKPLFLGLHWAPILDIDWEFFFFFVERGHLDVRIFLWSFACFGEDYWAQLEHPLVCIPQDEQVEVHVMAG